VYILGDLFDVWIGDDQLRVPFYRRVAESLREVSSAGVPVYVAAAIATS
jgi:UDP-2,3-diacylglucosamine hydrolase